MSTYYPDVDADENLYYVEFGRGDIPTHFTLFKRQFIHTKEDWEKFCPPGTISLMSREGHPWNILTDSFGPDGCVPDRAWVCWMVDALNEKLNRENKSI
jgi:hypothetical protein